MAIKIPKIHSRASMGHSGGPNLAPRSEKLYSELFKGDTDLAYKRHNMRTQAQVNDKVRYASDKAAKHEYSQKTQQLGTERRKDLVHDIDAAHKEAGRTNRTINYNKERSAVMDNVKNRIGASKKLGATDEDIMRQYDRTYGRTKGFDKMSNEDKAVAVANNIFKKKASDKLTKEKGVDFVGTKKGQKALSKEIDNLQGSVLQELKDIKKNKANPGGSASGGIDQKYMGKKFDNIQADYKNIRGSEGFDENVAKDFANRFKMGDKGEDFVNHVKSGSWDKADEMINGSKTPFLNSSNTWDKAVARKYPQVAGGALGLSWLVSNMSSSKGQQSNSQLYGQQQPYY